jgi:hypothetical protein
MIYTKDLIKDKIATDDRWLYRGILAIWRNQTKSEKLAVNTHLNNGIGFSGPDGVFLTSLGNILRGQEKRGLPLKLSEKQTYVARKRMAKYAGQLYNIIVDKAYEETVTNLAVGADNWLAKQFEEGKVKFITNEDYKNDIDHDLARSVGRRNA